MSWSGNIEGFSYESGKKQHIIDTIGPINRSKPYTYVGDGDLVFYSLSQTTNEQVVKTPLLRVPYDSLEKRLLILINDNTQPYTCRVLDEGGDKFGPGSFRVVNFSKRALKFMIGEEYGDVPPGNVFDANSVRAKPSDVLPIKFAAPFGDSIKVIYSNRWLYDSTERVMIFVVESDTSDNSGFMTKFFSERYVPPTEINNDIRQPGTR